MNDSRAQKKPHPSVFLSENLILERNGKTEAFAPSDPKMIPPNEAQTSFTTPQ